MTLGGLALAVGILVARRHRDDREHQRRISRWPEQSSGARSTSSRPSSRRRTRSSCRPSYPCVHLHRAGAAVPARRRCRLTCSSPLARSGGLRDDRVVHPVAHAGRRPWPTSLLRGQVAALQDKRHAARPGMRWALPIVGFECPQFDGASVKPIAGCSSSSRAASIVFAARLYSQAGPGVPSCCSSSSGKDFFLEASKSGTIAMHMRFRLRDRVHRGDAAKLAVLVDQQVHELLPGHKSSAAC